MAQMGITGLSRGGRPPRTTTASPAAARPADLVDRHFAAARPNQLWVADFTYSPTCAGMVYVAFVFDVFSRRLLGWRRHCDDHPAGPGLSGAGHLDAVRKESATCTGWCTTPTPASCSTPTALARPGPPRAHRPGLGHLISHERPHESIDGLTPVASDRSQTVLLPGHRGPRGPTGLPRLPRGGLPCPNVNSTSNGSDSIDGWSDAN
jgi:hypothetical protein